MSKVQHAANAEIHETRSRRDHKRLRNPRKRQNRCRFSLSFSHFYNRQCIALDCSDRMRWCTHEKQQKKSKLRVGKMRTSLILSLLYLLVALSFLGRSLCMQGELVQVHAESRFSSIKQSERKKNGQGKKEY